MEETEKLTCKLTCKNKVKEAMFSRLNDIRRLYKAEDNQTEDLGSLYEYGLSLDYVKPKTFPNQNNGYTRYQLSCGGPSEEFRWYNDSSRVEFWYLDWFDGAYSLVPDKDLGMIKSIMKPEY